MEDIILNILNILNMLHVFDILDILSTARVWFGSEPMGGRIGLESTCPTTQVPHIFYCWHPQGVS